MRHIKPCLALLTLGSAAALCASPAVGAMMLVEDFETGVGAWTATNSGTVSTSLTAVVDPAGGTNQVGALTRNSGDTGNAFRSLGTTIGSGSTAATVFYRFYLDDLGASTAYDHFGGVSKDASPSGWGDFTGYLGPNGTTPDLLARNHDGTPANDDIDDLTRGQ